MNDSAVLEQICQVVRTMLDRIEAIYTRHECVMRIGSKQ